MAAPVRHLLYKPEFPRSSGYDPDWILDHHMGPNPLWLVEWLCGALRLEPGMRVLDLGCGKALTSVYLAREHELRVFAVDLWVPASDNWQRLCQARVADRVCPIQAEAHALPFADGFFDAIVSLDAYQYFGTDDLYLGYLRRFVRPGGQIGVVTPALMRELGPELPAHLSTPQSNGKAFWEEECCCLHTLEWWRQLWLRSGGVALEKADTMPNGWRHWADFEHALEQSGKGIFPSYAEAVEADAGQYLGFVRLAARSAAEPGVNRYQSGFVR